MQASSQRPKAQEGSTWALNAAIEAVNLAKRASNVAQFKDVFGSVSTLLTTITVQRSLLFVQESDSGSHPTRTRRPTNRIMLNSGYFVLISVESLTGV